jgi:hypothetical protein
MNPHTEYRYQQGLGDAYRLGVTAGLFQADFKRRKYAIDQASKNISAKNQTRQSYYHIIIPACIILGMIIQWAFKVF